MKIMNDGVETQFFLSFHRLGVHFSRTIFLKISKHVIIGALEMREQCRNCRKDELRILEMD